MSIKLAVPEQTVMHLKPRISVIGVGGGGGNAVNNMIAESLEYFFISKMKSIPLPSGKNTSQRITSYCCLRSCCNASLQQLAVDTL